MRSVANVEAKRLADNSPEDITRIVDEIVNRMESSISIAQFSSFMIEGFHTEPAVLNGVPYFIG